MSDPTVNPPQMFVREAAAARRDADEVIADLVETFDYSRNDAIVLVTREFMRQDVIDDQNAADAEFTTE